MNRDDEQALFESIRAQPQIIAAAVTGSRARMQSSDAYSDLDLLLVVADSRLREVRTWLLREEEILLYEFHAQRYCSVLWANFSRTDLAFYTLEEPPSEWIVQDYRLVKGDRAFEAKLAAAVRNTRDTRAPHLATDQSLNNVLLLLWTARQRDLRGEAISAHGWLTMACDMMLCVSRQREGVAASADSLHPRRRLEVERPAVAAVLQQCLFAPPSRGIPCLAEHVGKMFAAELNPAQTRVLEYLCLNSRLG